MLTTAWVWLDRNAASIDAINVFPVPDGDTGTNMGLTLRAAQEASGKLPADAPLADVAGAAAHGALLGARGNSGVILSQWLRGLGEGFARAEVADGGALLAALTGAADAAYAAIAEPAEGTILSVARAVADCDQVQRAGEQGGTGANVAAITAAAVRCAHAAVERTPDQMPMLAEAGVVDAGARGLAVVLEGMHHGLTGEDLPPAAAESGRIDPQWLAGAQRAEAPYGWCTEFVLRGAELDALEIRRELQELGDSVLVVGETSLLHVHVHIADPQTAYRLGARYGDVEQHKAEDMAEQHQALASGQGATGAVAVVAVASGEGFEHLFKDLGVAAIVAGGATQNPSAEAILAAARSTHAAEVIVLPNHRNVIPAAEQAAALSDTVRIQVAPVTSQPAAIVALSALQPGADLEAACRRMVEAAQDLLSGEVTRAARAIKKPVPLRQGQPFALLEGEIVGGAETVSGALAFLAQRMVESRPAAELLTVYRGAEVSDEEARETVERLTATLPDTLEVELVIGGQPHYPYQVSLE